MDNQKLVNDFKKGWDFARQMTIDFIKSVPEEKWSYSPHEKYSPLCKQFRHMIWVSGLYREALELGKVNDDCSSKKAHYKGDLTRESILEGFRIEEEKMNYTFNKLSESNLDEYSVNAWGSEMGFAEFVTVLIQHESTHQGLWSFYAKLGEFETPKSWQENWGI